MINETRVDSLPLSIPIQSDSQTAYKTNKWAIGLIILGFFCIGATITCALYYTGVIRYGITGSGSIISLVTILIGLKNLKKELVIPNNSIHYPSTIQRSFGSIDSRLTISECCDEEGLKNLGYQKFVEKYGTEPFQKGTISVESKCFKEVFVTYIEKQLNLSEFIQSKFFCSFIDSFDKVISGRFGEIINKIKNLKMQCLKGDFDVQSLNSQWQAWLAMTKSSGHH